VKSGSKIALRLGRLKFVERSGTDGVSVASGSGGEVRAMGGASLEDYCTEGQEYRLGTY
jgi:hypothetical protein